MRVGFADTLGKFDVTIFISEDELFDWNPNDAFTDNWSWCWVQNLQNSPWWAWLWQIGHSLSHELLHILLNRAGQPRSVWIDRVHGNDVMVPPYNGENDYWISNGWGYRLLTRQRFRFSPVSLPGKTVFWTVGGEYS